MLSTSINKASRFLRIKKFDLKLTNILIILLVFFEFVIILSQVIKIHTRQNSNTKYEGTIDPIIVLRPIDNLKYFYELDKKISEIAYLYWAPNDKSAVFTTNLDGLNTIRNYSLEKPKDTYRIITLGDSFTFGMNVSTENSYPSQLEKYLNQNLKCNNIKKFEVLNLGVPGYDFQYAVERYKLTGQKYNPDLVLWFIIDEDMFRIDELKIILDYQYRNEMEKSGELAKWRSSRSYQPYPPAIKSYQEIIKKLGGENKILEFQKENLKKLNNYYKNKLVVFTFPFTQSEYKQVLTDFVNSRPQSFFYDKIPDIYNNQETFLFDHHPSKLGYQLITENLFNYLKDNAIIPCN